MGKIILLLQKILIGHYCDCIRVYQSDGLYYFKTNLSTSLIYLTSDNLFYKIIIDDTQIYLKKHDEIFNKIKIDVNLFLCYILLGDKMNENG